MKSFFFKHFKTFTGKRLFWGLFFNKVAGHQSCNFIKALIKKRLEHRYFLWLSGNLQQHLIWRTFANGCIGKLFVRTFFRSELSKGNLFTSSVKGCSNYSRLNENISYHKVLGEERKDLILIWDAKRFMQNRIKSRKYFSIHQYQNFRKF